MNPSPLISWHKAVTENDPTILDTILHAKVIFYSPILFKEQKGKRLTKMYLLAAFQMFKHADYFRYVKEVVEANCAVLEFNSEIDGIKIDGIDMITWNEQGQITEFKVMLRPMKAIQKVGEKMLEKLQGMSGKEKIVLKGGMIWDKLTGK